MYIAAVPGCFSLMHDQSLMQLSTDCGPGCCRQSSRQRALHAAFAAPVNMTVNATVVIRGQCIKASFRNASTDFTPHKRCSWRPCHRLRRRFVFLRGQEQTRNAATVSRSGVSLFGDDNSLRSEESEASGPAAIVGSIRLCPIAPSWVVGHTSAT